MRFAGRVLKANKHWAVEVPILELVSQGRSKKEALDMIADAVESLANRRGFKLQVFPGTGDYSEVGSEALATLTALLLRRARRRSGLSLSEVAVRLGIASINAYVRYKQGRSIHTVQKLSQLFDAVSSHRDFVVVESEA